jgi:hypothetical protein
MMDGSMWDEPYLETCCRSALHRLSLSGTIGRRADNKDGPCLARLETMGLAAQRGDGCYLITPAGDERHDRDVLRRPRPR